MPVFTDTFINIGLDGQVTILDNDTGSIVDLGGQIVEFEPKPKMSMIESEALANYGEPNFRQTFDGWELTCRLERSTDALDNFLAKMEANFFTTGGQKKFTIQDRMTNGGSATSTKYQYTGAIMMVESMGQRRKKEKVEPNLTFHAKNRQPIGVVSPASNT